MAFNSFSLIPSFNENLLSNRFSQIDKLFSKLTGEKPISDAPQYNLLQKNKENYELIINVPGYSSDELDISVLNNQLTITGKSKNNLNINNYKWIHKDIEKKSFILNFNLDHKININNALLDKGLLILDFTYNIPEEDKPKKININLLNEKSKSIKL